MFFYLIQNSTLLKKELDDNTRVTKIFLYGGISYIVLHATLFMGGDDSLLNSLKKYFWMFFFLDLLTMFLTNNTDININDIIKRYVKKLTSKKPKIKSSLKPNNNLQKFEKKVEKKVHFSDDNENEYSSDSDSDIGTDIDFEEFKQSLSL